MTEKNSIFKGDSYIWGIYIILCVISIIEIFSSSSYLIRKSQDFMYPLMRQMAFVVAGILLVVVCHNFHYKWVKAMMVLLLPASLFLQVVALFSTRWLDFGFSVQPSELSKLAMIITCAFILSRFRDKDRDIPNNDAFKRCLIVTCTLCGLIIFQNFSTAFMMGLVSYCMMIVAQVETKKLLILAGLAAALVGVVLSISVSVHLYEREHQTKTWIGKETRFDVWGERCVNFFGSDPAHLQKIVDSNRQEQHAYMAVYNSRGVGVMPGNGLGRDFIPDIYTDYMYTVIIEEWGIWGALIVMLLYVILFLRAGKIARECKKKYPAYLVMGLMMMIGFQAIVNMGVSVGLFPVTGQPLPLISRGGSSFLVTSMYFAIMLSVSRFAERTTSGDKEQDESDANDVSVLA